MLLLMLLKQLLKIEDANLYVLVVALSRKDNVRKQLSGGFEATVYWNKYN